MPYIIIPVQFLKDGTAAQSSTLFNQSSKLCKFWTHLTQSIDSQLGYLPQTAPPCKTQWLLTANQNTLF